MAVFKPRKVEKALLRKGFFRVNGHHRFYYLHVDGYKTAVRISMSHDNREIGNNLAGLMSKNIGLSHAEFEKLVECPLRFCLTNA